MSVQASPLAATALLSVLTEAVSDMPHMTERLESLRLDEQWLFEQSTKYRAAWNSRDLYGGVNELSPVSEELSLFLSWLLSDLRNQEACLEINESIQKHLLSSWSEASAEVVVPPKQRLALTMGVVGRPAWNLDRLHPAWFPSGYVAAEVDAAYQGLLGQVDAAGDMEWPEFQRTAVLWRFGGIAQGLAGDSHDLAKAMQRLNVSMGGALPMQFRRLTSDEWVFAYRNARNGLTHLHGGNGTIGFLDALDTHQDLDSVIDYFRLASFYMASSINGSLRALDPDDAARWLPAIEADWNWVS